MRMITVVDVPMFDYMGFKCLLPAGTILDVVSRYQDGGFEARISMANRVEIPSNCYPLFNFSTRFCVEWVDACWERPSRDYLTDNRFCL